MDFACVLVLNTKQTYGKPAVLSKSSKTKQKLLYKAVSYIGRGNNDEKTHFLVPYEIKYEFSKKQTDKYVIVKVADPLATTTPIATLTETLGNVDDAQAYNQYLYFATLNKNGIYDFSSISLSKFSYVAPLQPPPPSQFPPPSSSQPFTIDNPNTQLFDDAIRISRSTDAPNTTLIQIYITNVAQRFLPHATPANIQLLRQRISAIYLPHCRKDLFPKAFLESCNLKEGCCRSCIVVSFTIHPGGAGGDPQIASISHHLEDNVYISKNYHYDEPALLQNPQYQLLVENSPPNCRSSSHNLVAYWAVQTNSYFAGGLQLQKPFLYTLINNEEERGTAEIQTQMQYIKEIKENSGKYSFSPHPTTPYMHMTSPLRRFVDVLNQCILVSGGGSSSGDGVSPHEWIGNLEIFNQHVANIRKLENTTYLIHKFTSITSNPQWKYEDGVAIEGTVVAIRHNPDKDKFTISVFIPEWRFFASIKTKEPPPPLGKSVACSFFLFPSAHHYRNQKVRGAIVGGGSPTSTPTQINTPST